jgi:uncharacterized protein YecE (DUF72 family)
VSRTRLAARLGGVSPVRAAVLPRRAEPTGPGRIFVGTSGWHYAHWVGPVYPPGTRAADFLAHYAQRFGTVEINSTFYHLPARESLARWRDTVPRDFRFACKASRFITHMKKLAPGGPGLGRFLDAVAALGPKLGPILFQLPPRWELDLDRLARFLRLLPGTRRFAFEFRDPSWLRAETYALLAEHGAALCLYELAGRRTRPRTTADFVYVRLHGPAGAYRGTYPARTLRRWAARCTTWTREGRDVYCYFDNDERGYAARDALRLRGRLEGAGPGPSRG